MGFPASLGYRKEKAINNNAKKIKKKNDTRLGIEPPSNCVKAHILSQSVELLEANGDRIYYIKKKQDRANAVDITMIT